MSRIWIAIGALYGAGTVAMAAIAAHALAHPETIQSAIQIQGWHALALLFCGVWAERSRAANVAAGGFALGTALFSGAIYIHHLASITLGPIAPIGGSILIISWLILAASTIKGPSL